MVLFLVENTTLQSAGAGLQKSFDHQDEYALHMDFFHTTQ